jgi:hypothetical protein
MLSNDYQSPSLGVSKVSYKNEKALHQLKKHIKIVHNTNKTSTGMLASPLSLLVHATLPLSVRGLEHSQEAIDIARKNINNQSILKKVEKIHDIQKSIVCLNTATLFIIPAVFTIPFSLIQNGRNWHKTAKLNKILEM